MQEGGEGFPYGASLQDGQGMKKKKQPKQPKKISLIEVAKGVRKPIPPQTCVHGETKYKRVKKDWTLPEE